MKFTKLNSREQVITTLDRLAKEAVVAVDTETTGLDWHTDKLLSIVVGTKDEAYSFDPLYVSELRRLHGPTVIFQNFKFDYHFLYKAGVEFSPALMRDTMLLDHLREETESHALDAMVQRYFQDNYKETFWAKYDSYESATEADRLEYECKDVIYTARIYEKLLIELRHEDIPESLIDHVHRLALALWQTEHEGVKIDVPYVMEVGTRLQTRIETLKPEMRGLVDAHCEAWELDAWAKELDKRKTDKGKAGVQKPEFSFDSSKQLASLLYDRLRLPAQFDPKSKNITTGDDALAKLEDEHALIPILREYRGLQKVYGAYIEGTLERMREGRIYPEFNINGTKTGRISHSNPNLGQLPASGGIRGIYVPDEGSRIISADYQQLEVVLAAHFSGDKNLLRVVHEGVSLHDITAEGLGIPREKAKTINFAIQYGAGKEKIRKILQCSMSDADLALRKYWETYSGLKRLIDECHYRVNQSLPIVSPFGRKRHFPSQYEFHWEKARAHRQSFNALIQGTGGDLTSRAFYLLNEHMRSKGMGRGLFTVHDEILAESKLQYCNNTVILLQSIMKQVGEEINLTVPLSVSVSEPALRWED